jgi:hypothetical protein
LLARFGARKLAFAGVLLANAMQLVVLAFLPTLFNFELGASQLLPQSLLVGTTFILMTAISIIGIPTYRRET